MYGVGVSVGVSVWCGCMVWVYGVGVSVWCGYECVSVGVGMWGLCSCVCVGGVWVCKNVRICGCECGCEFGWVHIRVGVGLSVNGCEGVV